MIRKAILDDVNDIHALLHLYHKRGELLARPLSKLYDHLRDFWVFEKDLPIKVWSDCIGCVSFPNCDEIAMLKKL